MLEDSTGEEKWTTDATAEPQIDVMIGGAEKGGTTSLGFYVAQHPKIKSHISAETPLKSVEFDVFLDGRSEDPEAYRRAFLRRFEREPRGDELVMAKSVGILHRPHATRRLHRHNPNCRLIFSLRDPVERAYSAYWYQRWRGEEEAVTFERALEREKERRAAGVREPDRMYVAKSEYIRHLRRISDLFGRDQLYIVLLEELSENANVVVNQVYDFLGLKSFSLRADDRKNRAKQPRIQWLAHIIQKESPGKKLFRKVVPAQIRNRLFWWIREVNTVKASRPPMNRSTHQMLVDHFRPYNHGLEEFLGRELGDWSR